MAAKALHVKQGDLSETRRSSLRKSAEEPPDRSQSAHSSIEAG